MLLGAGDCFLIETNLDEGGYVQSHLHVVILDYEPNTGTTVLVVVETLVGRKDTTTILKPGDHEFIKQDSYVNYRRAITTSASDLQKRLDQGIAKPKELASPELLTRLRKGIIDSPFTPGYVKDYCRRRFLDELFD